MKTMIELINALNSAKDMEEGAKSALESGITSAKEIFTGFYKEKGEKVKDILDAWKAAELETGKSKTRSNGFQADYFDWLVEASRTEQEARDYIMAEGNSENTKNHLVGYLNFWALAESVRQGKKVSRTFKAEKAGKASAGLGEDKAQEPVWEYNAAQPYVDVRSAWETLKREKAKAKPDARRMHPDKVIKFGNPDLTTAYTQAFQTYNKSRNAA